MADIWSDVQIRSEWKESVVVDFTLNDKKRHLKNATDSSEFLPLLLNMYRMNHELFVANNYYRAPVYEKQANFHYLNYYHLYSTFVVDKNLMSVLMSQKGNFSNVM